MTRSEAAFGLLVLGLLFFTIFWAYEEGKRWTAYKRDHGCVAAGYMEGDVVTVVNPDGKVGIATTPRKTRWLCDEGKVEIYR